MRQSTDRATLRRRAGLSQARLAYLAGISAPRLCLWEKGEVRLKPEQIDRIATVLRDRLAETPVFENVQELRETLTPAALAPTE